MSKVSIIVKSEQETKTVRLEGLPEEAVIRLVERALFAGEAVSYEHDLDIQKMISETHKFKVTDGSVDAYNIPVDKQDEEMAILDKVGDVEVSDDHDGEIAVLNEVGDVQVESDEETGMKIATAIMAKPLDRYVKPGKVRPIKSAQPQAEAPRKAVLNVTNNAPRSKQLPLIGSNRSSFSIGEALQDKFRQVSFTGDEVTGEQEETEEKQERVVPELPYTKMTPNGEHMLYRTKVECPECNDVHTNRYIRVGSKYVRCFACDARLKSTFATNDVYLIDERQYPVADEDNYYFYAKELREGVSTT
ncbi:hypothetical protein AAXE64_27130 [Priestia megaterium]